MKRGVSRKEKKGDDKKTKELRERKKRRINYTFKVRALSRSPSGIKQKGNMEKRKKKKEKKKKRKGGGKRGGGGRSKGYVQTGDGTGGKRGVHKKEMKYRVCL
eukprot:TRINITY_DN1088_c1_g1_i2.p2 TRINITY_DN1088_c1_g1~~TRINITY_DN1088_c1_g1_i2.p2  ORF type:complete len:103 (-),score=21.58 TRINITY_DN1088_c1_g1_i2:245-553(-)